MIFFSGGIIPDTPIRGNDEPSLDSVLSPAPQTPSTAWHNQHRMIFVRNNVKGGNVCNWPIPESFWPDPSATRLVSCFSTV